MFAIDWMRRLLDLAGLRAPLGMVRQSVRDPSWAMQQFDILRDCQAFGQRYGSVLNAPRSEFDRAGTVLIVSLSDWPYQAKVEGLLAKALQLRGYVPVVLTHKGCWAAQRYFQAFGIRDFIFLEDFVPRVASTGLEASRALLPDGRTRTGEVMHLTYGAVDVGRHALSTVMRQRRLGSLDFSNPAIFTAVRDALHLSVEAAHTAERLVDSIRPDIALFLERGYTPYGELFDVLLSRGVNTIQWSRCHRPDALMLTRYDWETRHRHPLSLSPETWQDIRSVEWTDQYERELMTELRGAYERGTWFEQNYQQFRRSIMAPDEVRRRLGLDPTRKTAVIFSHVLWDASFFYGRNLFDDHEEWLVETVRAACQNPSVNWLVKLHPDYVRKLQMSGLHEEVRDQIAIRTSVGTLPDHVKLVEPTTDINTFSLFAITDYCLTVRGTIGIEMPCFGIPVLTAGTGRYSGLGFTIDSSSREEYLERLGHIQSIPRLSLEQTELAKKHAYALLTLRPWIFNTFQLRRVPRGRIRHPLDDEVSINARSFNDLQRGEDLAAFAEWACESTRMDFLRSTPTSRLAV